MSAELEAKDAGVGHVDETQPNPFTSTHRKAYRHASVDRDGIANPAVVDSIEHVAEVAADRGVRFQPPIVEHPYHVPVDRDRIALLDDQCARKAATDLLEAALVRVVPVGAGIRHVE